MLPNQECGGWEASGTGTTRRCALANRLVGYPHGGLRSRRFYDEATAWGSLSDDTELAA